MNSRDHDVVVECDMDRPPETVWRAITEPALVREWLGVSPRGEAEPGEPSWEIVEAVPCARLRYRWTDAGSDRPVSFVTFELDPAPNGRTRFRLTHAVEARAKRPRAANANMRAVRMAA